MNIQLQRGLTLIELMIAMAISLLIVLAITAAYFTGSTTQRNIDEVARVNETARFSFDLLSKEIRKSGFENQWGITAKVTPFCSSPPTTVGSALAGVDGPATTVIGGVTETIVNQSDVLRVQFYGEDTTATTSILDCQGNPVAANTLVADTLFVAQNPLNNNEPTLYCHTSNPANPGKVALVSGVESLQVLYGEDTDADGIINSYVPWPKVVNPDHILSIKVSVVARSQNQVATQTNTTALQHFGATYATPAVTNADNGSLFTPPGDLRLRKIFSTEIATRDYRC